MIDAGIPVTFRGRAWSANCREWVYFNCVIDLGAVRRRFSLPPCVEDRTHRGTHDGSERGLMCVVCQDAIMGALEHESGMRVFA
jgi:hypothetical protein